MGHTVGLLALQGAIGPHEAALRALGADTVEVRTPAQLDQVDALVVPGGESTTMTKLLVTSGLAEPLARRLAEGMPTFGTCAGMIVLAAEVLDGRPDQQPYAAIDITVRRNAFGRQVDSFEADLPVSGLDDPFHAVFIRAPFVEEVGVGVEVLAEIGQHAVLCRQGNVLVSAFHPELTPDLRVHHLFLSLLAS